MATKPMNIVPMKGSSGRKAEKSESESAAGAGLFMLGAQHSEQAPQVLRMQGAPGPRLRGDDGDGLLPPYSVSKRWKNER
jgi:hypothetical protein